MIRGSGANGKRISGLSRCQRSFNSRRGAKLSRATVTEERRRSPPQHDPGPYHIEAVRLECVEPPAPQKRQHDEHAAIRCIDTTEAVLILENGDDPVEDEDSPPAVPNHSAASARSHRHTR